MTSHEERILELLNTSKIDGNDTNSVDFQGIVWSSITKKISSKEFLNIDFSHGDFRRVTIHNSKFTNCQFHKAKAKGLILTGSDFTGCTFEGCDFSQSKFNERSKGNLGSFVNCSFKEVNFKNAHTQSPLISHTQFLHCNFKRFDFDGARLMDCQFEGTVEETWFRPQSARSTGKWFSDFFFNPFHYENKMENIDFSHSTLNGVSFLGGIDLTKTLFPEGKEYILVKNPFEVYTNAKKVASKAMEEPDLAISIINTLYLGRVTPSQSLDFIDSN